VTDDTRDAVHNAIEGDPTTAVQFRDVAGNVYINSPAHTGEPARPRLRPLNVLAVDDEPHALEAIVHLLRAEPRIGEVNGVTGAEATLRFLNEAHRRKTRLDALFLDILMPGLTGLDLARVVSAFAEPPAVVFVTALEAHAVEAFELKALDYLLKPVQPDRLAATVDRLIAPSAPGNVPELLQIDETHFVAVAQIEHVRMKDGEMTVRVDGETVAVSPEHVRAARALLLRNARPGTR
jgi:DNA-binding LytR/AlgR family response regulator